ncbi:MAG TPA: SulP family inorganic anion transporter [Aggregatilineaceae bacterium]|nr:SulP family inorganic anion transporter [Aggregatilineaceae bacterium]
MISPVQWATAKLETYLRRDLASDLGAGLTGATAGVPQAMAFALVAGISPIYGLYTAFVSTIVSSLVGSSTFMTTGPTNALAVVVGSTLAPFSTSGDLLPRLVTLTFLVGVIQLGLGLLQLGGLARFVSTAVMTGFVTGAALLVLLGQLGNLTGIPTGNHDRILLQTGDLIAHLTHLHAPTFAAGVITMSLILLLHKTRFTSYATLIAITVTGVGIALFGGAAHGVTLVRDLSRIPHGLPGPRLPQPALMGDLFSAALAIAVLGLVQSAALAHSIKEPDGRTPDASREFVGQGLGNLVGALFQSMPAGGSLSRTAVNINAGARTRWANVWAGVFVAPIMLLFGSLVERIPLAALAGHLIVAAGSLISLPRLRFVWRASWAGRWAMTATFASTLILPLQYSVYVGVFLSLSLYVHQSSRVMIVQLEPVGDNLFREVPLSQTLPDGQPVILSIHGNLFFAAARDLEQRLPSPNGTRCPVVILRLRGDTLLAGTGASMLATYAERLRAQGGKLILCGVEKPVLETLKRTGTLDKVGGENVFPASELLLASMQAALEYAQTWLAGQSAGVT